MYRGHCPISMLPRSCRDIITYNHIFHKTPILQQHLAKDSLLSQNEQI